jgi:hypothetical protein
MEIHALLSGDLGRLNKESMSDLQRDIWGGLENAENSDKIIRKQTLEPSNP